MSIVVMAVGSRGDVQPFIPIGLRLAERHRVRIATHREFRSMVEEAGLEFYPLAGDPHELMEYMARRAGASSRRASASSSKRCRPNGR
jgi:sterol 3beta-glucosyltransferase